MLQKRASEPKETLSPIVEVTPQAKKTAIRDPLQGKTGSLQQVVDSTLDGTKGTYAVAIKNLKTGESYYTNEHASFYTASLYKLWIMVTTYKRIEEGVLTKDQILTEDVTTLNTAFQIASQSAELTDGVVTYSVRDAVRQMITISHNYAAMLLTEKIRLSSVARFLKENGLNESTVGTDGTSPKSTTADIALFLEKLYNGDLANEAYTAEMIGVLKKQQLNEGIPKYLPDTSKVANKTGEIDGLKHDAGIVFSDTGDYILVVMSDSDNPKAAQERIALLSKGVFEYFNGK